MGFQKELPCGLGPWVFRKISSGGGPGAVITWAMQVGLVVESELTDERNVEKNGFCAMM